MEQITKSFGRIPIQINLTKNNRFPRRHSKFEHNPVTLQPCNLVTLQPQKPLLQAHTMEDCQLDYE